MEPNNFSIRTPILLSPVGWVILTLRGERWKNNLPLQFSRKKANQPNTYPEATNNSGKIAKYFSLEQNKSMQNSGNKISKNFRSTPHQSNHQTSKWPLAHSPPNICGVILATTPECWIPRPWPSVVAGFLLVILLRVVVGERASPLTNDKPRIDLWSLQNNKSNTLVVNMDLNLKMFWKRGFKKENILVPRSKFCK